MNTFPSWREMPIKPLNDKIDYDRAGAMEAAIRAAAEEHGFTVARVYVRAVSGDAPEMEIELRQQPREAAR